MLELKLEDLANNHPGCTGEGCYICTNLTTPHSNGYNGTRNTHSEITGRRVNSGSHLPLVGDTGKTKQTITKCLHLGEPTGETIQCEACGGNVQVKVFGCGVFGECTLGKSVKGVQCCKGCPDYTPTEEATRQPQIKVISMPKPNDKPAITVMYAPGSKVPTQWAYGVTTVPSRLGDYLPRTLESLRNAGFTDPWLFIDGTVDVQHSDILATYDHTVHSPRIRAYGNWILGLGELLIRNPTANRFAMFQDDLVTCIGLREYLESVPYPDKGYLNLFTNPSNQIAVPPKEDLPRSVMRKGVHHTRQKNGWFLSHQNGRGALALVFDRDAVVTLMTHHHMIAKTFAADVRYRHMNIDGGVIDSMKSAGYKEYVHNPSLVQHTGTKSVLLQDDGRHPKGQDAVSFRGEDFDPNTMLTREAPTV